MPQKILIKRGDKENLPVLDAGEPAISLDSEEFYIGGRNGNISIPSKKHVEEEVSKKIQKVTYHIDDFEGDFDEKFNMALDTMDNGDMLVLSPEIYVTSGLNIDKPITLDGKGATILYEGETGVCLSVGVHEYSIPKRNEDMPRVILKNLRLQPKGGIENTATGLYNVIGLQIINIIKGMFSNIVVDGFTANIKLVGSNNNPLSQNLFENISSFDSLEGVKMFEVSGGWTTENTFLKGQFVGGNYATNESVALIVEGSNNNFYDVNFENNIMDRTIVVNGNYNTFINPRLESLKDLSIMIEGNNNKFLGGFNNKRYLYRIGENVYSFMMVGERIYQLGLGSNGSTEFENPSADVAAAVCDRNDKNIVKAGLSHSGFISQNGRNKTFFHANADEEIMYISKPSKYSIPLEISQTDWTEMTIKNKNPAKSQVLALGGEGDLSILKLGSQYLWTDSSGNLRRHSERPSSGNFNSIGTVIG